MAWLVVVLSFFTLAVAFSVVAFHRWKSHQVLTSVKTTEYPIQVNKHFGNSRNPNSGACTYGYTPSPGKVTPIPPNFSSLVPFQKVPFPAVTVCTPGSHVEGVVRGFFADLYRDGADLLGADPAGYPGGSAEWLHGAVQKAYPGMMSYELMALKLFFFLMYVPRYKLDQSCCNLGDDERVPPNAHFFFIFRAQV